MTHWSVRRSRSLRCSMAATLLVTALALAGCRGMGDKLASGQADSTSSEHTTSAPSSQEKGSQLIARPDVGFSVLFKWQNPDRGEQGYFLWRQGTGMRRWDIVKFVGTEDAVGSFSIETDFSGALTMGWPRLDCLWGRVDSPPDNVLIGCGTGLDVEFMPVQDALHSKTGGRLSDRTIAGRSASCYSFAHPEYSLGVLCVDSSEGIPLLLTTENLVDTRFSQSMQAAYVSTADPGLVVPFGLEADPREGFPDFQNTVPFSTLELLDLSGFKE
jgi:hypothetical protein